MKKDCPLLNNDKKKNKLKNFKKKRRAFQVNWDDSDSSSSSDSEGDSEQANVYFMDSKDEVRPELTYDEIIEISIELDDKYKESKK